LKRRAEDTLLVALLKLLTLKEHFTDNPIYNYKDSGVAELLQTNEHEPSSKLAYFYYATGYIQANSHKLSFIAEKGDRLDFAPGRES
jgi:hypothetical protein